MLKMTVMDEAVAEQVAAGGSPLLALCRKEVESFESMLRQHPDYRDGLTKIERSAIEGYIYQKLRGHVPDGYLIGNLVNETVGNDVRPQEGQDGSA